MFIFLSFKVHFFRFYKMYVSLLLQKVALWFFSSDGTLNILCAIQIVQIAVNCITLTKY